MVPARTPTSSAGDMRYSLKVLREPKQILMLDMDASDEMAARAQAIQQGYVVLTVKAASLARSWNLSKKFSLPLFSQQLLALMSAGLSLVESLEGIAEKESSPENRKIFDGLITRLRQGLTFSAALEAFPAQFPQLYVAMVRASERTGDLSEALSRYLGYWEQSDKVRSKIVSASIYPGVIMLVGAIVSLFLMFYVVPRFSRIYDDMRGDVPILSRLLLEWGNFVENYWFVGVFAGVGILALIVYLTIHPEGRAWLKRMVLRVPKFHEQVRIYQLARLYRTMGMLLRGGIPVLQALDMSAGLIGMDLRAGLQGASGKIREGQLMSRAMEEYGLTTPVALRLMRVGERTGHMGDMLERIAAFHDEELARWVEWFTRLFEPALMALIGVVIGGIVILMYMPIFELAGSIQ